MQQFKDRSELFTFIESKIISGPQWKHEIYNQLFALSPKSWLFDNETFTAILEGLKEKYNPNFYGFEFFYTSLFIGFNPIK